MNIRLVIFDFDGTMADTRHNIVPIMQRVMQTLGMPVADEETCASTIGLPLKDCFRKIFSELTDDGAEHCAETCRQIFFANAKDLVPNMFPNVQETIDLLHAHQIRMAIASSRTSASLLGFIHEMHLSDKIAMVVGSDEELSAAGAEFLIDDMAEVVKLVVSTSVPTVETRMSP